MKELLKKLFIKLGIKDIAVKKYLQFRDYLYRNRKEWYLDTNGIKLKFHTKDAYSWMRFYGYNGTKVNEPGTTKVFADFIDKNSVVLDVGAHLGYFTCIAGYLAKEVHSLEVDPKCIAYIQDNVNLNELDNVKIHNLAISDKKGIVKIQNLDSPNSGITINTRVEKSFVEVDSLSLDEFIKDQGIEPDFIKIDIEGAEGIAIKGMSEILKKDIVLLLEIHDRALRRWFNIDYKDILSVLIDHNFSIERIDHRSHKKVLEKVNIQTDLGRNSMLLCRKIKS